MSNDFDPSIFRAGRLHSLDPQAGTGGGFALSRIGGHENIGFQRHGAAYVYGIHAAQYAGFQTRNRLAKNRRRQVADGSILDVGQ